MQENKELKLAVVGGGKMGKAICDTALELGYEVVVVAKDGAECFDWVKQGLQADCVVDFSYDTSTAKVVEFCKLQKIPLVTGTTGLAKITQTKIEKLATCLAVCQSSNFSLGIAVLKRMVRRAVGDLFEFGFACELTEKHHANKKDCPSGTAKAILAEMQNSVAKKMQISPTSLSELNFDGWYNGGEISLVDGSSVSVHSFRCGEVAGKHEIGFLGSGEELSIVHQAYDKKVFAKGALAVAKRIISKCAGLYAFEDFVFVNKD